VYSHAGVASARLAPRRDSLLMSACITTRCEVVICGTLISVILASRRILK